MARRRDPKEESLAEARCLNPHPEQVTDSEFLASDFFDARDAVQVKYEMVRKAVAGGVPVTEAAARAEWLNAIPETVQDAAERCVHQLVGAVVGAVPVPVEEQQVVGSPGDRDPAAASAESRRDWHQAYPPSRYSGSWRSQWCNVKPASMRDRATSQASGVSSSPSASG